MAHQSGIDGLKKRKCNAGMENEKGGYLNRDNPPYRRMNRRISFLVRSEHTEQDCHDDGKPEQPTQDCKGYLQNNFNNEA